MQKIFDEVNSLDTKCYEKYHLNEDILMEHASDGIKQYISKKFSKNSTILIACGGGNNGADGITLARLLHGEYNVSLYLYKEPKTPIGKIQLKRAQVLGIKPIKKLLTSYDVVVDCVFGSGLSGEIEDKSLAIIKKLNDIDAHKIACDIPSGIQKNGIASKETFKADITLTMGALKMALFLDGVKEYIGKIKVIDLGVSSRFYEDKSNSYVLEQSDLKLPSRDKLNTNKGTFGHLAVIVGQKEGAANLSAMAGFALGSGLVSLVAHEKIICEPYIMQSHFIPKNTAALALGMGLGKYDKNEIKTTLKEKIPKVIDADLFYSDDIKLVLEQKNCVLTPHPKEFCSLLKILELGDIAVEELQKYRIQYVKEFCKKYPSVVLVLKGANTIIAQGKKLYINPLGDSRLSFGGSGDVLAGFIASLLAQGYEPIEAAKQGSIIHTLSAKKSKKNKYALNPFDLIKGVSKL